MSAEELTRIVSKARKVQELQRARARVRQLERELSGAPASAEPPAGIPGFLRAGTRQGPADRSERGLTARSGLIPPHLALL
jgi:hypothetical protein